MTKTQTNFTTTGAILPHTYLVVLNSKGQRHATAFEQDDTVLVLSRHLSRRDAALAVAS